MNPILRLHVMQKMILTENNRFQAKIGSVKLNISFSLVFSLEFYTVLVPYPWVFRVPFWTLALAVIRFFYKIVYRTALKIWPFYGNSLKSAYRTVRKIKTVFSFNWSANRTVSNNQTVFHLLQQKKNGKWLGFWYANNFKTKNGRFIMTLSYQKLTVFRCYTIRSTLF